MIPVTLAELATLAGAVLLHGDPAMVVSSVGTDSRELPAGALFLALEGERFDGHRFAAPALEQGACAVMVRRGHAVVDTLLQGSGGVLAVEDTLCALQDLARALRLRLAPRVVGVTGSNGKTTTKDFTRAVLATRYEVLATRGNLNNHIGVPLTLLDLEPRHRYAVVEMGMNHRGEIADLAAIARPDRAVVTNAGRAHLEFLGSLAEVVEEKTDLYAALPADGVAIIHGGESYAAVARRKAPCRVLEIGMDRGELRAENVRSAEDGGALFDVCAGDERAEVRLPVAGTHMVGNALLALAVGWVEGVPLADGAAALANARLHGGRMQARTWRGMVFLDDSYNANPDSMVAALNALVAVPTPGKHVAVLGAMGELGEGAEAAHREVGETAARLGVDLVCTVGDAAEILGKAADAAGAQVRHFPDHAACARQLENILTEGDRILVKGSRTAAMENVLRELDVNFS